MTTTQNLSGDEAPKRLPIGSNNVLARKKALKDAILQYEKDKKKKKKKKKVNVLGLFAKNED